MAMSGVDSPDWYVSEQNDDSQPRKYWKARDCPLKESCSKTAWGRAACYSFVSQQRVIEKVENHLSTSGKHMYDPASFGDTHSPHTLAMMTEIDAFEETGSERAKYRNQIDKMQNDKLAAAPRSPPMRPPIPPPAIKATSKFGNDKLRPIGAASSGLLAKRPRFDDAPEPDMTSTRSSIDELRCHIEVLAKHQLSISNSSSSNSNSNAAASSAVAPGSLTIPKSQLLLLRDSIRRVACASDSMMRLSLASAGQYERETDVLKQALNVLDQFVD
jgi:hypothetical protein